MGRAAPFAARLARVRHKFGRSPLQRQGSVSARWLPRCRLPAETAVPTSGQSHGGGFAERDGDGHQGFGVGVLLPNFRTPNPWRAFPTPPISQRPFSLKYSVSARWLPSCSPLAQTAVPGGGRRGSRAGQLQPQPGTFIFKVHELTSLIFAPKILNWFDTFPVDSSLQVTGGCFAAACWQEVGAWRALSPPDDFRSDRGRDQSRRAT